MTNVFISWSGERSKEIAEELRKWIPSVLQFAKPYFTPNDIEKGAKWSSEISKKLSETNVGIICLTKENTERPWILFEAGALSKDLERSKVCSILFGVDNSDVTGPLTTFQTTSFDQVDFRKLMTTINESGEDRALPLETFDAVFTMWWPKLETKIQAILDKDSFGKHEELRSERELLEEILDLSRLNTRATRSMHKDPGVPLRWLDQFLTSLSDSVDLYEQSADKEMYSVLRSQFELCDFLVGSDLDYSNNFRNRLNALNNRFEEIIPF